MPQEISFLQTDPKDLRLPINTSVNAQTGEAITSVEIPVTSGRNGFQPLLNLVYSSGGSNSVFGMGWNLQGIPVIGLSLKEGYPKYDGTDKFSFNGQELIPWLEQEDGDWKARISENTNYFINYYRSTADSSFTRFEKWIDKINRKTHWRVHSINNQVMIFGKRLDDSTKVLDGENPDKIFQWLLEAQYDNIGNVIKYGYKEEDSYKVNGNLSFERNRIFKNFPNSQKYLKYIRYGNQTPEYPNEIPVVSQNWLFEIVFDYGDQEKSILPFRTTLLNSWPARLDPFSSYIAGFEQRTYRLCEGILMFHNFSELGTGATLVGNMELIHDRKKEGTTLSSIKYTGYKRNDINEYDSKSFPPVDFEYTIPEVEDSFSEAPARSSSNLPIGLNGLNYKWTDLYGEGLPGILYESNTAWYYKPNLGDGKFGLQQKVMEKPGSNFGSYTLSDFDGDGNLNIVVLQGKESGYFEYNRDKEQWNGFSPFINAPSIRKLDTNTQLIDLTGDGRSDIVTVEDDRTIWYPSKGKEGFGSSIQITKPVSNGVSQAPTLGSNPMLDYFFADMNGSGLPDQVHIYNGKVEYWPNMGNGKFGPSIVMGNAPQLDFGYELDASRIRLVDLDGSGTSDLVYIGRGEITYYINASGNQFLEGVTIKGLPFIDNISSAQIIDFLGDGSPCLVWSSALAVHQDAPLQFLRLTNGIKPRLLITVNNNMGLKTQFHYGHSGKHYLRDKFSAAPWITKLPLHRTVVDKLETIDQIGNTRFNQLFEYHDGYFDGEERAFRGFCLVDQYDSEVYNGTTRIPETSFTDPICVRTWYHNGAPGWSEKRRKNFYSEDSFSIQLSEYEFEENNLQSNEYYDAIRTLAGQTIRIETYGINNEGVRKEHPFQVNHTNFLIRKLQPRQNDDYKACFVAFQQENLEVIFEENPVDPKITHNFNLELDDFGIPKYQTGIAYPRTHVDAKPEQQAFHLNLLQTEVIDFDTSERYEIGIPLETKGFLLHNDLHPPPDILYGVSNIRDLINETISAPVDFNEPFSQPRQAKLLQWNRKYFWNDRQSDVLPWGEVGSKVLMHHEETACFNTNFLRESLGTHFSSDLPTDGGYILRDNFWWQASATMHYNDRSGFYLSLKEVSSNGAFSEYLYDDYYLALVQSATVLVDTSGIELARNIISANIDYHVIAPNQIIDANRNTSEVNYDAFGVVTRSSAYGQLLSSRGALEAQGHGKLSDYVVPTAVDFERVLGAPENYIQECASFFYYELDTWERDGLPLRSVSLAREQWVHDGEGNFNVESRIQVSIDYQDGFARSMQSKTLIEPGPDTLQYLGDVIVLRPDGEPELVESDEMRWRVSGHNVYNNKQEVVQQYEPYFSPKVAFESDEVVTTFGESTLIEYDALGRQKKMELADGTFTKVEFTPWYTKQFDANDTVTDSLYNIINSPVLSSDSPEEIALAKSKIHYNTPITSHLDGLGRVILVEESDENGRIRSNHTIFDALGNPAEVIDARGLTAYTYFYDMQGRVFHETSMDSGPKWQFIDALNRPTDIWDTRNVHQQLVYDTWGRITHKRIEGALGMNHLAEHFIYAEDSTISDPWQRNLVGQLVEHFDQAGLNRISRLDILGNVLEKDRRLVEDYKNIPDWSNIAGVRWSSDPPFESKATYDALGRPIRQELPDKTIRTLSYLQNGALDQLLLTTVDGTIVNQPIVEGFTYNARGQIKESTLGNGVVQQYDYNAYNYRLKQKRSFRRATTTLTGKQYQHIDYTYDAVGNITHLIDTARPNNTLLYNQPRINQYTYDAFYQLVEAEGRTHEALERTDYTHALDAPGFVKGTRHISSSNMNLVRTYTRRYSYDLNGNMESMRHRSGNGPSSVIRWRRDFWIDPDSNRSIEQNDLAGNPVLNPASRFDQNGNLNQLSHLREMRWNYLNQLSEAVLIERPSGENDTEYYVYGGDGQRIRKVTQRRSHGSLEITEKLYLDGCEIKRIRHGANLVLERYTSHISDGNERIALMHRWTRDTNNRETDNITQKKIHYQLNCHLGSSAYELNEEGDIINYEEYFAFGGSAFVYGDSLKEVHLKEYRYSGKERDDATGFYYYGFRYYAPWLGRWLNPDPIGPEDGLNVYQFVHNNPINAIDVMGLQSSNSTAVSSESSETFRRVWTHPTEGTHVFTDRGEELGYVINFIEEQKNSETPINIEFEGERFDVRDRGDMSRLRRLLLNEYFEHSFAEVENNEESSGGVNEEDITGNEVDINEENSGTSSGNGGGNQGGSGTGGEAEVGSGMENQRGNSGPGTGNENGAGSAGGEHDEGTRRRRRRGGGEGTGRRAGGRPGGTGSGNGATRRNTADVPTGPNPDNLTPQNGSTDPNASIDGSPNGSLTAPENVNSELQVGTGDPNGSVDGSASGQSGGTPPEELEWWQTALIVVAVAIVAIAVTVLTFGAALAVMGVTAASATVGQLMLAGAVAGLASGLIGDATSQLLTIAVSDQLTLEDYDVSQTLFSGGVGFATGGFTAGLGGYANSARTALLAGTATRGQSVVAALSNRLGSTAIRRGATYFATGALEGAGTETLRQGIFEDNFDVNRILTTGAMSGGISLAVGGTIDLAVARSQRNSLTGAGSNSLRPNYPENPSGTRRTPQQALDMAERAGVWDPDDEFHIVFSDGVRTPNADADYHTGITYGGSRGNDQIVSWDDLLSDINVNGEIEQKIQINVDRSILSSDDRIIGTIAHEMHELRGLRRRLLEGEGMRASQIQREIDRLHLEAVEMEQGLFMLNRFIRAFF